MQRCLLDILKALRLKHKPTKEKKNLPWLVSRVKKGWQFCLGTKK